MKARKTMNVEDFKNNVNAILDTYDQDHCPPEYVKGIRDILEDVLMKTGNYRGFKYLTAPSGNGQPGIRWNGNVAVFNDTDDNRVKYF